MAEIPVRSSAVSVVVLRAVGDRHEVLLLKRNNSPVGEWCQIVGSLEDGETAWQGGLRELAEETGLVPDRFYSADDCEQFYRPESDDILIIPVFVGFVSGQREVALNDEHSDYAWLTFKEARRRVPFSGQRRVLKSVQREFVRRKPNPLHRIDIQQ